MLKSPDQMTDEEAVEFFRCYMSDEQFEKCRRAFEAWVSPKATPPLRRSGDYYEGPRL